ncbi:MAG TPA: hypothetical protein VMO52_01165 [Acidimicrobiia bacterium]|nr:hypothetical protein [Acidimicrobiia bacterium]
MPAVPPVPGPVLTVVVVVLSATPSARFVASVHPGQCSQKGEHRNQSWLADHRLTMSIGLSYISETPPPVPTPLVVH